MKKLFITLIFLTINSGMDVIAQESVVEAQKWRAEHGAEILEMYQEILSIPNHASDLENITKNGELLVRLFKERGFEMRLLTIEGAPPVVYGERMIEGVDRTYGFYVHYDGQPVDRANWKHDPFDPVLYDGPMEKGGVPIDFPEAGEEINEEWRIYARSASDDKAPLIALLAAIDAIEGSGLEYTSNIKFFFDGEEESSSPHVESYLTEYGELFEDIDIWMLCDGAVYPTGDPSFKFGSRGITGMQLTVYGSRRPLHSGHYGNWAPVPGQMLARLLTSMKDENGKVLIDGFYDTAEPLTEFEKNQVASAPNIDNQLKEDLGIVYTEGEGASLNERVLLPSLTIRGLASGSVGDKTRNIIPSTAIAQLGMRLVKGNDPEHMQDLVEQHIIKQGWHIVREEPDQETRMKYPKIVKVIREDGYPASKISMNHPEITKVIDGLKEFTGDSGVFLPGTGASNRIYGLFFNKLNKPGISITMVNPDNNQHAANENVRIGNLWYGIDLMSVLLTMPD